MLLADVSVKRPVFATMLNVILIVFGLFSYGKLGIDQFPNIDFPVVTVQVTYPGADPKTVEQKILQPLEKGLNGIEGLEALNATAFPNFGQVVLRFKLERNGDKAAQDVRDKMSALASQLPVEALAPVVAKFDIGGAPIITMTLSASELPYAQLSKLAKDKVKPALETVNGVGRVDLAGQREREIHILMSRARLQSFGLSPAQVVQAVQSQNTDVPSGKIENEERLLRIRTEGTLGTAEQVGEIPIPLRTGQKIRVKDIGEVQDTLAEETGYATANGQSTIVMVLYKQSGGNTVAIAETAKEKIRELQKTLPEGVKFEVFQDNSKYIKGSIDSVKFDLFLGALLAVVIVLVFLHDWRATIISACAIPTSVIATFWFVQTMGFTLNLMTTLGLTLSIGILVDDAIVVIENIYRRLETGETPLEAAKSGTAEIGLAAIAITLSIVAVFVPVAFMEGILGRFFYQFGMTVAFSVLVSLFVAFTLTPMMSSRLLKAQHGPVPKIFEPFERAFKKTEEAYRTILRKTLKNSGKTVLAGAGVLVVSIVLLRFVPVSFFPKEDRSQFQVNYELPEGTPLSKMKDRAAVLDQYLRNYPGVDDVLVTIGANAERKPNAARLDIRLIPKSGRSFSQEEMVRRLRTDLKTRFTDPSEKLEVSEQSGSGGGRQQPIQLILQGNDSEQLTAYANRLSDWVKSNIAGAVDVQTSEPPMVQEIKVVTDPVRAADVGMSTQQVGFALRTLFEGIKVGEIEDKGERYDVRAKVADVDSRQVADLAGLTLPNAAGIPIALANIARIEQKPSLSKVERLGGQRQIVVLANFQGKDLGSAIRALESHVKSTLPQGMSYNLEGQAKLLKDAVSAMLGALALAIILVFIVLCAQFESYLTPFVIMMSVPLAFSGAFAGLLITQKSMSIYAMIGLIMLMGLVTKNAILLIDFALAKMREGLNIFDALLEAGPVRLRPILMTTAAMIFGMLPIAIGHGDGGEARAPMAVCVIGGLISSTLLTLVVVPSVFVLVRNAQNKTQTVWTKLMMRA
ncbi:MAG: efflux RND transporter permease subunit [Proteobacteria bacterium]|nr:efflux RND transporter permease subunit [Pseudomonadota bacterium]